MTATSRYYPPKIVVIDSRHNDATDSTWYLVDIYDKNISNWIHKFSSTLWFHVHDKSESYVDRFTISEKLYTVLQLTWS